MSKFARYDYYLHFEPFKKAYDDFLDQYEPSVYRLGVREAQRQRTIFYDRLDTLLAALVDAQEADLTETCRNCGCQEIELGVDPLGGPQGG